MENCGPEPRARRASSTSTRSAIPPLDTGDNQASADGIHYQGSYTNDQGSVSTHWDWVLEGCSENP